MRFLVRGRPDDLIELGEYSYRYNDVDFDVTCDGKLWRCHGGSFEPTKHAFWLNRWTRDHDKDEKPEPLWIHSPFASRSKNKLLRRTCKAIDDAISEWLRDDHEYRSRKAARAEQ